MRAMVIGAAGQVGRALMTALVERGHRATGVDRLRLFEDLLEADASDPRTIGGLLQQTRPDWLFYSAGFSWVDGCEDDPQLSYEANVTWPLQAATLAGERGVGFTYYSSEYVFDGQQGPYDENAKPNPLNTYGHHKLEAEGRLPLVARTMIVRTTVVYGPDRQRKNFAYQVIDRLRRGEQIRVPSDQISSPTYNLDLAEACVEFAELGVIGTFNIAGPDRFDRATFAQRICACFGLRSDLIVPSATSELAQGARRPLSAGLDSSRARRLLATTIRGVDDGLAELKRAMASEMS